MKKLRVGVVYGGRSGEHEVSVTSAGSIFKHIDRDRYEPVAIRIEKDGRWTLPDQPPLALTAAEVIQKARTVAAAGESLGRGEPAVLTALIVVVAAQLAFTYVPAMQSVFETEAIPLADGALIVGIGVALLILVELPPLLEWNAW